MERKIGEIFEVCGEWYQCVEQPGDYEGCVCDICSMNVIGNCELDECFSNYRADKKSVVFKKLEKIGEPYSYYFPTGRIIYFQRYECYQEPIIEGDIIWHWVDPTWVGIEIKQNKEDKEDMEEKKLNLKPFDIQKAREGKPVCTRDGRNVRIICFDCKDEAFPIVALVSGSSEKEEVISYDKDGFSTTRESKDILFMLTEKKEGWLNVYKEHLYKTKEDAVKAKHNMMTYIDTIKISWEE